MMAQIKATQFAIAASFLALLAGCASQPQATLADGTMAYRIDCDRSARGLNYCFELAGKSCGANGYSVVDRDGQLLSSSRVSDSDSEALVRQFEADPNSIFVRCGS